MLYKHVAATYRGSLTQVYLWFTTGNSAELKALRATFGDEFYRVIGAAFVCDNLEHFESVLEIPARSGKALLPLIASALKPYLATRDTRISVAQSREN
jgi:hypothetical protein